MNIDPDRPITITVPFGMIVSLKEAKPILSMFRDQGDVKTVIEIIDAIYAGALEYIREEEGEIREYLKAVGEDDIDDILLDEEEDEKKRN
jgi:hypothetical protein